MKRVYVYQNRTQDVGKLVALEETKDFITHLCALFRRPIDSIRLYTVNGCEINDLRLIRDEEKIYLCSGSETDDCDECKVENSLENRLKKLIIEDEESPTENSASSDWITLNVGGRHFTTSRSTLLAKEPSSMLARMFAYTNNNMYLMSPSARDETGAYLIDRSPEYFEPILNYLRHGEVILDKHVNPKGVLEEASFYGIESMIPELQQLVEDYKSNTGRKEVLTRMDVVRAIILTPTSSELRFQGVDMSGADLSRLDLRNINFKYACLSNCNLTGANLSHCCLERADLSHANLEGAQLLGVKALCANMEGANLKGSNMEDPLGSRAVMEGVNLKGANLEGSNMAGVNLRVATLKNANLRNCDLRTAVLAGADLEYCDLSGSDLHDANLRGANLKDTAFELMLTPLHMSQTIR
ncbi:BTB/POZ domain-containing protein KCTD9 [Pectinophora gossypiella]|uniref:BTB/POZ domain-containing protein KCTD9 n=1 Tax=Pectinophora gossypiella TaxID=13191 RepID=UPI00214F4006|nr:BTB/POZ domain-containing protein KCTD9 [Pectinophora gossypiella]